MSEPTIFLVIACLVIVVAYLVWLARGLRSASPTVTAATTPAPLPIGDIKTGPDEVEVILTIRDDGPADIDSGTDQSHDLVTLATIAAPSARYVYGDPIISVSVVIKKSEEDALRNSLKDICRVEVFVPLSQRN